MMRRALSTAPDHSCNGAVCITEGALSGRGCRGAASALR